MSRCCEAVIERAVEDVLDEVSEGSADPMIKADVVSAVVRAIESHRCEEGVE